MANFYSSNRQCILQIFDNIVDPWLQAVQLRRAAREEVQARKRLVGVYNYVQYLLKYTLIIYQVGGAGHPPTLVAVLPLLDSLVPSAEALVTRLTSCVEDVETARLGGGHITTFTVPRWAGQ